MAVKTIKNLVIDQGSTFSATISVTTDGSTAKTLTGYTTTGQIRKSYGSSTATDFTTSQVDGTGVITISLTATQTHLYQNFPRTCKNLGPNGAPIDRARRTRPAT